MMPAPGPSRTADILLRSEALYPSELQAQNMAASKKPHAKDVSP